MCAQVLGGHSGASFSAILGHEDAKRHLSEAVRDGHISHAYLFEGIPGVGKKTLADAFVAELLGNEEEKRLFAHGNHPDVKKIRPLPEKKSISKEQIQTDLVGDIDIRPYRSRYKVYIIEEADKLTVEAQNTMLKTIEEPPSYGVILLLAERASSFLPTIISRCVKISLQPLSPDLIVDTLVSRGIREKDARAAAVFAQGSLGKALMLLSDEDFSLMRSDLFGFLTKAPELEPIDVLRGSALFETYKKETRQLLDLMLLWVRDELIYLATGDPNRIMAADYREEIVRSAERYSLEKLTKLVLLIRQIDTDLSQNVNRDLALDKLMTGFMIK
ncbi:MAG: DNA polymerase III subunit delta' [Firmicutes bacterium]|nr:DNA polymerase III subunit delta' [Bacillota bacterium]